MSDYCSIRMSSFEVHTDCAPAKLGVINPDAQESLKFKCYRKRKSKDSQDQEVIVTTKLNGITFCGENFGANNFFQTDTCNYYIGQRRKGSKKIKVFPAELFQLEPQFAEKVKDKEDATKGGTSFIEQKYDLIKQFGSGKMQRSLNKRLKEKLDKEVVSKVMEGSAKFFNSAEKNKLTDTPRSSGDAQPMVSFLPPHDLEATEIDNVFKLDDIVPPDIRDDLSEAANELTTDVEAGHAHEKYYETVLKTSQKFFSGDEESRILRYQCLTYLQYMMHLYMIKSDALRRRDPLPTAWDSAVKSHLLDKFTFTVSTGNSGKKRQVPTRIRDLQMSYIMILNLRLNNYEIDLSLLASDLKVPVKKLQQHAQALGCKVTTNDQVVKAVLKFPVHFPGIKKKTPKKRIF